MEKYFYVDDTPTMPDHYLIRMNHDKFLLGPTIGSYNLIMARLLNISYPDFMRLCRDDFDAVIIGKNTYYPVAYFPHKIAADMLCNLLNARADLVMFEHNNPDFDAHKEYVEKYEAKMQEIEAKINAYNK